LIGHCIRLSHNHLSDDRLAGMGIEGWSWDDVLPFFKKVSEELILCTPEANIKYLRARLSTQRKR
jgi:choline dehydrogenase-like flavoprotein